MIFNLFFKKMSNILDISNQRVKKGINFYINSTKKTPFKLLHFNSLRPTFVPQSGFY